MSEWSSPDGLVQELPSIAVEGTPARQPLELELANDGRRWRW